MKVTIHLCIKFKQSVVLAISPITTRLRNTLCSDIIIVNRNRSTNEKADKIPSEEIS